jgi:uncharacterized protein YggE
MRTLSVVLCLTSVPAMAAPPAVEPRTITVTGDAEVKVPPDEVTINLGLETFDKELSRAKKDNDERIKKVMAACKTAGVEEARMATDQVRIEPRYNSGSSYGGGRATLEGYTVRRGLQLTLRDVSRFDAVLTAALEAGANVVHGIHFGTTELRKHRDAARSLAMKAALEKATALAKEYGMKPGKARTIQETGGRSWSSYGWGGRGGGGGMGSQNVVQEVAGAGGVEGTMAPGMVAVGAGVSVVFDLE